MASRNHSALAVAAGVLSALTWLARPAPGEAQTGGARDSVGIVVRLSEPPVARYAGGIAGLAPTSVERTGDRRLDARSRAVASYRAYLTSRQDAFVAAARTVVPEAKLLHRYQMVLGGVALRVPAGTLGAIGALPGVVANDNDAGIAARAIRADNVTASGNTFSGIHGSIVGGRSITTNANGLDGVLTGSSRFRNLTSLGNGRWGIHSKTRATLVDSTLTGNTSGDVATVLRPRLRNTTCGTSAMADPSNINFSLGTWGVCQDD